MKQLLTTLVVFMIISAVFSACNNTAHESGSDTAMAKSTFDLAAARKIIDSANIVYASLVKKGDSAGLAAMYTSDAKFMASNMPAASGRKEIQTAFAGLFAAMGSFELIPVSNEIWGTEELVAEEGTYKLNKDGKEIDKGKYIVLWKMEDGKWKLFRDCFNSDLPSPK